MSDNVTIDWFACNLRVARCQLSVSARTDNSSSQGITNGEQLDDGQLTTDDNQPANSSNLNTFCNSSGAQKGTY
jgi:hypothetical protein